MIERKAYTKGWRGRSSFFLLLVQFALRQRSRNDGFITFPWKSFRTYVISSYHRPSRYIRSVPYNLRDSILSSPLSISTTCTNHSWPCSTHSRNSKKKKTCRPIPSSGQIGFSTIYWCNFLVDASYDAWARSIFERAHTSLSYAGQKMSDHLFFSALFFSTPTLSLPQSNPRARLQKYWLFRQLHCW